MFIRLFQFRIRIVNQTMSISFPLITLFLFLFGSIAIAKAQSRTEIENQFQSWLKNDLWPQAKSQGISPQTFNAAFSGITINWKLPDLVIPGKKAKPSRPQAQSEFRSPARYFNENNIQSVVAHGRKLYKKHAKLIAEIEKKYGVPGRILLAIWGRESAYGRVAIPHSAFQVLGTKAFMSTRKALFRKEVLAGLRIIENGYATPKSMKSSWAGAMGQPQFLPSSYLEYAVDFDGDGKRNIWGSTADTLASIANYLNQFGWEKTRDWGYEAKIPARISCALEGPDQMRPISKWAEAGITRISGKAFPAREGKKHGCYSYARRQKRAGLYCNTQFLCHQEI